MLRTLRRRAGFELRVLHVHHGLRENAEDDLIHVSKYCRSAGIPFQAVRVDAGSHASEAGMSVEEAARALRYEALEQAAREWESESARERGKEDDGTGPGPLCRIAVAHHKNDLAETMMMNLFRGAGLEGLVNPKARTGNIIRPLLCCTKNELEEMLRQENIRFAVDKTNLEPEGTRNVWRNVLFPEVEKRTGVNASGSLNRTYSLIEDDLDYLASEAEKAYESCLLTIGRDKKIKAVDCEKARKLAPAMSSRVIRKLWQETFGNLTDFETANLKLCS